MPVRPSDNRPFVTTQIATFHAKTPTQPPADVEHPTHPTNTPPHAVSTHALYALRQVSQGLPLRHRTRRNRHILVMRPEPPALCSISSVLVTGALRALFVPGVLAPRRFGLCFYSTLPSALSQSLISTRNTWRHAIQRHARAVFVPEILFKLSFSIFVVPILLTCRPCAALYVSFQSITPILFRRMFA